MRSPQPRKAPEVPQRESRWRTTSPEDTLDRGGAGVGVKLRSQRLRQMAAFAALSRRTVRRGCAVREASLFAVRPPSTTRSRLTARLRIGPRGSTRTTTRSPTRFQWMPTGNLAIRSIGITSDLASNANQADALFASALVLARATITGVRAACTTAVLTDPSSIRA